MCLKWFSSEYICKDMKFSYLLYAVRVCIHIYIHICVYFYYFSFLCLLGKSEPKYIQVTNAVAVLKRYKYLKD